MLKVQISPDDSIDVKHFDLALEALKSQRNSLRNTRLQRETPREQIELEQE